MIHPEVEALFSLQGKTAMVVGGAVRLGLDISSVLAAAGADVIITSRDQQRAEKTAAMLREKYPVATLALALDHTNPEMVGAVMNQAWKWKNEVDILINNAGGGGVAGGGDFVANSPANAQALIKNNLLGAINCCRTVAGLMITRKQGRIINIASIAGLIGRDRRMYQRHALAGQAVEYAAAKAGILGLTLDLAAYLGPHNITVNAISPGGMKGEESSLPDGFLADYANRTPLGRFGEYGRDIKGAVLFLASPAADYVTGHNLVVDGGFSRWQ